MGLSDMSLQRVHTLISFSAPALNTSWLLFENSSLLTTDLCPDRTMCGMWYSSSIWSAEGEREWEGRTGTLHTYILKSSDPTATNSSSIPRKQPFCSCLHIRFFISRWKKRQIGSPDGASNRRGSCSRISTSTCVPVLLKVTCVTCSLLRASVPSLYWIQGVFGTLTS